MSANEEGRMIDVSSAEDTVLSDERRATLAPKLRLLLEDLRKLAEMESPDREPATTPFGGNEEHRGYR
jgi:hypothetical protein